VLTGQWSRTGDSCRWELAPSSCFFGLRASGRCADLDDRQGCIKLAARGRFRGLVVGNHLALLEADTKWLPSATRSDLPVANDVSGLDSNLIAFGVADDAAIATLSFDRHDRVLTRVRHAAADLREQCPTLLLVQTFPLRGQQGKFSVCLGLIRTRLAYAGDLSVLHARILRRQFRRARILRVHIGIRERASTTDDYPQCRSKTHSSHNPDTLAR